MRAAKSIHNSPDLLSDAQQFPTILNFQEFTVPDQVRLYREGPPLLYRHLPFWLANLVYRLWLAALAAFAIFIMFTDWIPKLFKWVINLRVGASSSRPASWRTSCARPARQRTSTTIRAG